MAEKPTSLRRSPMARGVDEFIEKMRSVPGVEGLRSTFASAIGKLGFHTFVYGGMHFPQLGDDSTPYILTTFPESWQRRYFELEYHRSDPVITESLHRVTPMKWNHLPHRREFTHKEAIIMNEAREHGLVRGFTIPVHGHAAEFGLISLVSSETEREFDKLVTAYGHQVHLMAIYLHGAIQEALTSAPSMTQDSQTLDYVRFSGYENTSMHMAVSRGSGAIGTADRGPEHAAEGGLALADRASVGGGMRHHGDHAAHRDIKADGVALAGALPGGRGRWPVARQEPAAGDAAAERRHQDAGG